MPSDAASAPRGPWGAAAIVGVAETDYVRSADQHVCDLILSASMDAILDAGLPPADVDGLIPPPGFMPTEEIAANLGTPDAASPVREPLRGARPSEALKTAPRPAPTRPHHPI